jgi:CBS domain-containing protein
MLTTVRDILRTKGTDLWFVNPETHLIDALKLMAVKDVGALLVLEDKAVAGIISERDFVRRIALKEQCTLDDPVSEMMTPDVITVNPSQDIEECMEMMTEEHIRHLPVVENGIPIGMVSIGDVIKSIITSHEFTIEQMEKYISGSSYNR